MLDMALIGPGARVLDESGRDAAWAEIEQELRAFEGRAGFEGPCEMVVAIGVK